MVEREQISVTTTGGDGAAVGNGVSLNVISGRVLAIHLDYHASAPATTDVTVTELDAPTQTILSEANVNTDGWYYPRQRSHDNAGDDQPVEVVEPFVMNDHLKVAVAGCNALTGAVVATVLWEE